MPTAMPQAKAAVAQLEFMFVYLVRAYVTITTTVIYEDMSTNKKLHIHREGYAFQNHLNYTGMHPSGFVLMHCDM